MFIRTLIIVVLLLAMPAHATRLALVIGNADYSQVPKLRSPVSDAAAMAGELTAAGFTVQLHRDLHYRGMVQAVETFTAGIKSGDEVVVFFSGHGVQIESDAHLVPIDMWAETEADVRRGAYGLSVLSGKLRDANAAFSLVIVDAGRSNPFAASTSNRGSESSMKSLNTHSGQLVMYSGDHGQDALDAIDQDDPSPHGVFTRVLLKEIRRPGVSVDKIFQSVRTEVAELASSVSHEQVPVMYGRVGVDFFFTK